MARIKKVPGNLFPLPTGAYIVGKGYVYVNTSSKYISASERKSDGKGYTTHTGECIGVLEKPEDKKCRMFYANDKYRSNHQLEELPDPPDIADSIAVGLLAVVREFSESSGLAEDLTTAFGSTDAALVLDLAAYMVSRESAVMQHFPAWAREHAHFSGDIRSDSYIGTFLKEHLTIPKIKMFRRLWLSRNIGTGYVYLCYDSTNVNSQAEGVAIVQRGHAKDDPTLGQVNTDYVIRQEDGLPLTYLHSPGSVTDIVQAGEMIRFIDDTKKLTQIDVTLCLICDRGYISVANLKKMDQAGISYLMMLRSDLRLFQDLADSYIDTIRSYKNVIVTADDDERYGITVPRQMYEDGPLCYAHLYWSASYYSKKRKAAMAAIECKRAELEQFIQSQGTGTDPKELENRFPAYFRLKTAPGKPRVVIQKKRGRGEGTKEVEKPTVLITGYEDDEAAINREIMKAGIIVMLSRDEMTAQEAEIRYHKRDCVEKAFEALKSHLGMDKIGVTTEEAIHGKGLVWFTASIMHALLFNLTDKLRATDRKSYTTESMVDQLEAIKADRELPGHTYKRRYKLTRKQNSILGCFGLSETDIDEQCKQLSQ
ncbi:MAG: transposase [Lachnospiraceae bacterium]|jgi:transposase|nr:transposase [Lachnospiraceae bacterium]